ncbi:MAG: sigma-54 dependent transcriptional regulator [Candidatus Competibacteraceae bacterium]|jgi:DNA-binding NtrC family response regulator|nr:sigma-54 dependent transcriptional regulator [Candidatus Competibacteraceae bacterium]
MMTTATPPAKLPILLVDDEPPILRSASISLRASGFGSVLTLDDSRQVLPQLAETELGVLVLDLTMPHLSGQTLLERIVADYPDIPVIIMTATDNLSTAVDCMKMGAFDYLVKPVDRNRLIASVTRALEVRTLRNEVWSLKELLLGNALKHPADFADIMTQNPAMHAIFRYTESISVSEQPVLITGETGTGKELIAKAVHTLSKPDAEFIAVDVAGLDDNVFTDTLFGHSKGAFTGAERARQGLIAKAAGGTLFLDEIGDLKETSQVKLLRLLQQRQYYPLGSDQPRTSTARIVVATNRDLTQLMKKGEFRKDLFYRLRGHHIHLPPLRERKDDLSLLLNYFLEKSAQSLGKSVPTVPTALYGLLKTYAFPGNVRELEAMVHDAVARHQGHVLSLISFKEAMGFEQTELDTEQEAKLSELERLFPDQLPTLKEVEQYLVDEALRRADGNQGIAASMVGLTRQALNKRLVRSRQ